MNENEAQGPSPTPEAQPSANLPASAASGRIDRLRRRIESAPPAPVNRRRGDLPGLHGTPSEAHAAASQPGAFIEYWHMIRRRKWLLVLATILGAAAGVLYTLPQTPVFQATTTLEVLDADNIIAGLKEEGGTGQSVVQETNLETQVNILSSETLRKRVIHRLATSEHEIEQPVNRLDKWRKVLNLPATPKLSREEILSRTSGGVTVSASSSSRIIRIDVDSSNPRVAADYANTLAEEFIDERLESHWQATQKTSEWLTRQLEDLKVRLVASEDALQSYARQTNLQFTDDQSQQSVAEEKLRQMQSELSAAQEDRIAKESRYELAEKAPIDSLPEVIDDDSLRTSHQKLTELRRELADALVTYTPETPKVKRLQSQISSIESDMSKVRSRILDRIHNELVVAQTREQLLTQAMTAQANLVSDQASKTVRYNILKRDVDTNREIYEKLSQQVKEAGIAAAMRSSNFRVVDPATPPSVPIKPSLRQGGMAGIVLGLFAGFGLVFLKESMDRSVALPGETSYYLGAPELAVVPSSTLEGAGWKRFGAADGSRRLAGGREAMVERTAFHQADSMIAESFRVALTSLLFANRPSGPPKAIAVSSPGPAEGKTTVACNLAISYAEINWRVLLIDGDMRRPRLHSIFGLDNEHGLANLLDRQEPAGAEELAAAIRKTGVPNLWVMPRGKLRSTVINLLYSPRFSEILQSLRRDFDAIVIDTPPMLHLPDARAIAHLTDGVVFVVRSGKTLRDTVITARDRFRQDGIPVLGSILNDWNPKEIGYYGHDNYEDYRTSYYGKGSPGSLRRI